MSESEQSNSVDQMFDRILRMAQERASKASGLTRDDYKYGSAESVRRASVEGYVYVTINGKEYGPVYETWGPLDSSKEKMTALVNTSGEDDNADNWIKLEYFDKDVKPYVGPKDDNIDLSKFFNT